MTQGKDPFEPDNKAEAENASASSQAKKATSKEGKKVTLTPEELEAKLQEARTEAGRKWKPVEQERDQLKTQLETLTSRLETIENQNRSRAYKEAEGDTGAMALFNRDESLSKRERDLNTRETEVSRRELQVKADGDDLATRSQAILIPTVAAKHGIEASELEGLGITDEAAVEKVAAKLAGKKPETEEEKATREAKETETEGEESKPFEPVSTESSGARTQKLDVKSVEEAPLESLEAKIAPPPK